MVGWFVLMCLVVAWVFGGVLMFVGLLVVF